MSHNPEEKPIPYPIKKTRVYMNATMFILSVILAATILLPRENSILLLLSYFVSTLVIAVATFKFRVRILSVKQPTSKEAVSEGENNAGRWRILLLFLIILIAFSLPLLLAGILPFLLGQMGRYIWFILIVSMTSGVSIAEILFYLYLRRGLYLPKHQL